MIYYCFNKQYFFLFSDSLLELGIRGQITSFLFFFVSARSLGVQVGGANQN